MTRNHHWVHWFLQLLRFLPNGLTVILFLLSYHVIFFFGLLLFLFLLLLLLRIKTCGKRVLFLVVEHGLLLLLLSSLMLLREVQTASWSWIFIRHGAILVGFFKYHIAWVHEIILFFLTFFLYCIIVWLFNHRLSLHHLCIPSIHLIHLLKLVFIIKQSLSLHCQPIQLFQLI